MASNAVSDNPPAARRPGRPRRKSPAPGTRRCQRCRVDHPESCFMSDRLDLHSRFTVLCTGCRRPPVPGPIRDIGNSDPNIREASRQRANIRRRHRVQRRDPDAPPPSITPSPRAFGPTSDVAAISPPLPLSPPHPIPTHVLPPVSAEESPFCESDSQYIHNFLGAMDRIVRERCTRCLESWFNMELEGRIRCDYDAACQSEASAPSPP
ncbi:hypothetical protein F4815DRAFT_2461 [Daldinia loculata]|nr:hypothetical protein F4815DRAFT_2461 [Daldinia loculata]